MLTFHGRQELKDQRIAQVRADLAYLAEILLETLAATRPPAGSGLGTGD